MIGVNKILMPNITAHMLYQTITKSGTYAVTSWNINGTFEDNIVTPWVPWDTLTYSLTDTNSWGMYYGIRAKHRVTGVDTWIVTSACWWNSSNGGPYSSIGQYNLYGYNTVNGVTMSNRTFTIQVDPTDGIIKWSTPQGLKPLGGLKYSDYQDYYFFCTNNLGNSYNYGITTANISSTYKESSHTFMVDEYTGDLINYCSQYIYDNNITAITKFNDINDFLSKCVTNGVITSQQLTDCKIYNTNIDLMSSTINENTGIMTYNNPITITPSLINPDLQPHYMIMMKKILTPFTTSNGTIVYLPSYIRLKVGDKNDITADIKLDYINRIDTIDGLNIVVKLPNTIN